MAEFIRIWDEDAENYVEYDTTVVEVDSETVYVPVSNISISRPVSSGTVNKVIDTNAVTKRFQSLEVSQVLKPITIEKSYTNRFSIERSNAKTVSVKSSTNDILVNSFLTGQRGFTGQKGNQGNKGDDFSVAFDPNSQYVKGDVVSSSSILWKARVTLDGTTGRLAIPAENSDWSQITDNAYLEGLPLTSGYTVSDQTEWESIRDDVVAGDLINFDGEFTLTEGLRSSDFSVQTVGTPLIASNPYFATTRSVGFSVDFDRPNLIGLRVVMRNQGILFGEDIDGGNGGSANARNNATVTYFGNGAAVKWRQSFVSSIPEPNNSDVFITYNVSGIETQSENFFGSRFFGTNRPGIEILGTNHGYAVGDAISSTDGSVIQTIVGVNIFDGNTFYDVEDYTGFEPNIEIFLRTNRTIQVKEGRWYVKNAGSPSPTKNTLDPASVYPSEIAKLAGIEDGAQVNYVEDVNTSGVLSLDVVTTGGVSQRTLSTIAEENKINSVGGVLSIGNLLDSNGKVVLDANNVPIDSRHLTSTAQVNHIDSVETNVGLIYTASSRELSLDSTKLGGSGNGGKVLRLRSDGHLSSSVFGQMNLSETETFATITERNAFTGRMWNAGNVAIITGSDNVGTCRDSDGTEDTASTDRSTCETADNEWFFVTGTFVYEGLEQEVAGVTENEDWVELATPTGTVSSVAGKSGIVTLAIEDISGLDDRIDRIDTLVTGTVAVNATAISNNATDIGTATTRTAKQSDVDAGTLNTDGDPSALGDDIGVPATGLTVRVENNENTIGSEGTLISGKYADGTGLNKRIEDNYNSVVTTDAKVAKIMSELGDPGLPLRNATQEDVDDGLLNTDGDPAELGDSLPEVPSTGLQAEVDTNGGTYATLNMELEAEIKARDMEDTFLKGEIDSKQNILTAGTNVSVADLAAGKISVENTSGLQTTVVMFGRGTIDESMKPHYTYELTHEGGTVTIVKFEDGDEIDIQDLIDKGWEIQDNTLDTDIWEVTEINSILQRKT